MLRADAVNVHVTSEPSTGLIGQLARAATETLTGQALACLYTADRFHHLDTEILPHLSTGHTVICDRYVPSTLVMQRFDGVDLHYLWAINRPAPRPTLAVILEAKPATIEARLAERGPHNRFQRLPSSAHMETDFYADATRILAESGYELLTIECTTQTPQQIAATINDRLTALTRRTNHQA
jgi:dTMP kinase